MRLRVLVVGALVVALGAGGRAAAQEGWISDDGLGAGAGSGDQTGDPDSTAPVVTCEWGGDQTFYGSGRTETVDYVYAYIDQLSWRIRPSTGEVWVQSWRLCFEGDVLVSSTLDWRRVSAPNPRVLAEGVYDEVVRQIPVPVPALSPVGPGAVHLGMWLAVAEPAPISVTARAGDVWATTSAELVSTTFDMGDGTVVVCDGAGDPIPESQLDSVEASPVCGHTYTDHNDRTPFTVTITSTWRVAWTGSGGAGGDLGTLDRTSSLDYRVLEIQTVGS